MIYTIYLEAFVGNKDKEIKNNVKNGPIHLPVVPTNLATARVYQYDYNHIFMAPTLLNEDDVQEYHQTHIILLGFLFLKEILIYFFCVRRAYNKLAKEAEQEASKTKNYVLDDNYVRGQ